MLYTLKRSLKLPIDIETAWHFLSSPRNLKAITPKHMGFVITSDFDDEKMYPGQIICYKVSPFLGIPLNWVTEITHVQEPNYFVDEQRFGPYGFWHHKHFIYAIDGGVEMIDTVHYKLPGWFFGRIMNTLYVRHQLNSIFDFRVKKLQEIYGTYKEPKIRRINSI